MSPTPLHRIAILGTHSPRQCGIAAFTTDLARSVSGFSRSIQVDVYAIDDGNRYAYPANVIRSFPANDRSAYHALAEELNAKDYDCLSIQHEYGIFGGRDGEYVLDVATRVRAPIVTTCHTILQEPNNSQQSVLKALLAHSDRVVSMTRKGLSLLREIYDAFSEKVVVIPHGIPSADPKRGALLRKEMQMGGRPVILTFGLLSPDKGIHHMVKAMNSIAGRHPEAVYVVVGATHPHLLRHEGEKYRDGLHRLVAQFGLERNVLFVNRFVSDEDLAGWLAAADIYVTPYLKPEQITSGTLAYAVGSGTAVVSTPYWHAKELLEHGRGLLVPFGNVHGLVLAVSGLLSDPRKRHHIASRALEHGRHMRWPEVGKSYVATFERIAAAKSATTDTLGARHSISMRGLRDLSRLPARRSPGPFSGNEAGT